MIRLRGFKFAGCHLIQNPGACMGLWTFYFFAKLYLYYAGMIRFDVLLNLLLLAFLVLPLPKRSPYPLFLKAIKYVLSMIFGILLLWHDTWFPSPLDTVALLKQQGLPSREYVYSFLLRFYGPKVIIILAVLFFFCFLVRRYRRIAAVGTAFLLLLPLFVSSSEAKYQSSDELDKSAASFFNAETTRFTHVKPSSGNNTDFDIIILHICSLSWDDLRDLDMEGHPFFQQFDYLFTNFNSVTTYSNPSAIRLLNANCGQSRHNDLYNPNNVRKECSLFDGLRTQGYEIHMARNHNGKYGNFDNEVKRFGQLEAVPFTPTNLAFQKYMFDDSPVYDDYPVLEQWWKARQKSGSKKVVLYYNSVSLHDGTHRVDDKNWWGKAGKELYRGSVMALFDDLTKFFNYLAASGRDIVIIFVSEHGRSIHGSAIAPPGLRDIPLPRITTVPVGIKFIKKGSRAVHTGRNIIISKPTSYFALSYLTTAFTEQSPFRSDRYSTGNFANSIPQTDFVAENQGNLIIKKGGDYYLFGKDKKWTRLSENELQ
jgi:cellulose synthase operon protein YhjU